MHGETIEYATPGNLVVFPSVNKYWIKLPDGELPDVPDKVVDALCAYNSGKMKKRLSRGLPRMREVDVHDHPDAVPVNMGVWTPTYANDVACLKAMSFCNVDKARPFVRPYKGSEVSNFTVGCYQFACTVAPCPICCKPTGHQKNQYVVNYKASGERRIENFSKSCIPGGRPIDWTPEGLAKWSATLRGTEYAGIVALPPLPVAVPLEAYLIAPALRAMDATWRLGNLFKPEKPGEHVAFMRLEAGESSSLVGITTDGRVELGTQGDGHKRYVWRSLTPKATLAHDASLRKWFAKAFPHVHEDAHGMFVVHACADAHCGDVADPFLLERAKRKHANCKTHTSRPWAFLKAMAAHESLKA